MKEKYPVHKNLEPLSTSSNTLGRIDPILFRNIYRQHRALNMASTQKWGACTEIWS